MAETRNRAQSLILAGDVKVDGHKTDKAGVRISRDARIEVARKPQWASRGALKLLKALESFSSDPSEKVCIDIGASSGGFTDVLLSRGAKRVFAIDVGYGQLDWRLRMDPRVTVMERTNARYLEPRDLDEIPDMAVADVSFISICKILPAIEKLISFGGECIALVKPQFEAGRGYVGKNGVVREKEIHHSVLLAVRNFIDQSVSLSLKGADFSPILGPKGNVEFLFHIRKEKPPFHHVLSKGVLEDLIEKAHTATFS